ncbi:FKBP12-interacting protein, partial [Tetrabaena socialis]
MEDDLYGGDLYGDAGAEYEGGFGDEEQNADYLPGTFGQGLAAMDSLGGKGAIAGGGSIPAASDLFSDPPGGQEDTRDAKAQQAQQAQQAATDRWRNAFKEVASICVLHSGNRDPDVHTVLESMRRLKATEASAQEELRKLRRRDAALQLQLADRNLEALELRRELAATSAASDPSVVQLKQLMLDPAVAREFGRLRGELEAAQAELATAREELTAVTFTQESKVGRQLMAKCRSLQVMEDEAEELQREVFALRARVTELEREAGLPLSLAAG